VYGPNLDIPRTGQDKNMLHKQVDDLVSDHIASHILIQNSFIPAPQVSILKWKSWQDNIKQH